MLPSTKRQRAAHGAAALSLTASLMTTGCSNSTPEAWGFASSTAPTSVPVPPATSTTTWAPLKS